MSSSGASWTDNAVNSHLSLRQTGQHSHLHNLARRHTPCWKHPTSSSQVICFRLFCCCCCSCGCFVLFVALKKRIPSKICILSCFVRLKSVLFNPVCVLDLARLVQKRATQYCVKVSSFAELSTNTCTLVCSFDFVVLGSGAFDQFLAVLLMLLTSKSIHSPPY